MQNNGQKAEHDTGVDLWEVPRRAAYPADFAVDELVYSELSRYSADMASPPASQVKSLAYGVRVHCIDFLLPDRLEQLAASIHDAHLDGRQLLDRHTAFPFFRAFMSADVTAKATDMLLRGSVGRVGRYLPLRRYIERSVAPRVCPSCIAADTRLYGRPIWNRVHQLPHVEICHIHTARLLLAPQIGSNLYHLHPAPASAKKLPKVRCILPPDIACKLACETAELMRAPAPLGSPLEVQDAIRTILARLGYFSRAGLNLFAVQSAIAERLGARAAESFGLSTRDNIAACLRFRRRATTTMIARPAALLALLAGVGTSLAEITAQLAQPTAVRFRAAPGTAKRPLVSLARLEKAKGDVLQLVRCGATRMDIARKAPGAYTTILTGDRTWWNANAPRWRLARKRDWEQTDVERAARVAAAAARLQAEASGPNRPSRITKTRLVKEAGIPRSIFGLRMRLPRTWAAIVAYEESRAEFAVRLARSIAEVQTSKERYALYRMYASATGLPRRSARAARQAHGGEAVRL